MVAIRFAVVLGVVAVIPACVQVRESSDPLTKEFESQEACVAKIDSQTVRLKTNFQAKTVKSLITKMYESLKPDEKASLKRAAEEAMPEIHRHAENKLTSDGLLRRLSEVAYLEFGVNVNAEIPECGYATFELLPKIIYRYQGLERGALKDEFASIGRNEAYDVSQVVMLMLTMEASGEPWETSWFSKLSESEKL